MEVKSFITRLLKWVKVLVIYFILSTIFTNIFAFYCLAQSYAVNVTSISPPKSVSPGDFVTVVFSVENEGEKDDTYQLETSLPEGWTSLGTINTLSLSSGSKESVFISVMIPGRAEAGKYQVKLTATSKNDSTVKDSATASITVKQITGVKLEVISKGASVQPGQRVEYKFRITNQGNVIDRFEIKAESSHRWSIELSKELVELLPGGQKMIFQ